MFGHVTKCVYLVAFLYLVFAPVTLTLTRRPQYENLT